MVSRTVAKYIRVSPRKVRGVMELIRGKDVVGARLLLTHLNKRAKLYIEKALNSAVSNAKNRENLLPKDLYISKIVADQGPMLKRQRVASRGHMVMVRHRTCHIIVELDKKTSDKK